MLDRSLPTAAVLAVLAGVTLQACGDVPSPTATHSALNALGRDGSTVTVPIEIRFGEGRFVVVPFGDPRIPEGTPTEGCPVGNANPDLGIPAGFPNGGGIVVSWGDGQGRHLGHLATMSTRCAAQFYPSTEPPFVNFDLRIMLTAADGSEIFLRTEYGKTPFTPAAVPILPDEVVGGTGRFQDASGWLSLRQAVEVTCTDDSGFCLEGTWSGGVVEGEIEIPRP